MPCQYTAQVGVPFQIALTSSPLLPANPLTSLTYAVSPFTSQCDVNEDNRVDFSDGAGIIAWLNANGGGAATPSTEHMDMNDDGFITPLDALWLFNFSGRWQNDVSEQLSFQNGVLSWTPLASHVGTYLFTFSAIEEVGQQIQPHSSITVQITVSP